MITAAPIVAWMVIARIILAVFGTDREYGRAIGGTAATVQMLLFVVCVAGSLGLLVWNQMLLQGRTGQSIGKRKLGLRLVGIDTNAPVGPGKACARYGVAVALSVLTCGIGWLVDALWPLWDPRGQRIADKVVSSIVRSA